MPPETVVRSLADSRIEAGLRRGFRADLTAFSAMVETPRPLTRRAPEETFRSIEFAGVSFTCPGTEQPVLEDVGFVLEAGRHYSLVGANGSGKSTIAKLMLGLYRPDGGRILVNGIPIPEWSQEALNGLFGVVLQNFQGYQMTLRDNVVLADVTRAEDEDAAILVTQLLERRGLYHEMISAQAAWYRRGPETRGERQNAWLVIVPGLSIKPCW